MNKRYIVAQTTIFSEETILKNNHEFFHQLLQLSRSLVNRLNEKIAKYDLNHPQWMIINYLYDFGSSTLVEIAKYLNVEKSSVTRTVNRLEKSGFVQQVPS